MNVPMFAVPVQGSDSDERYTPVWVFRHMDLRFDLDPCSPVGGGDCVPAGVKYTLADDGLAQPWFGRVWCNPPFSNTTAFADKFIAHGDGIFLGPIANSRWTADMFDAADLVWFCRDFAFTHPTHSGKRSNMPLMFCAIGPEPVAGLQRLAATGAHRGCLMRRVL